MSVTASEKTAGRGQLCRVPVSSRGRAPSRCRRPTQARSFVRNFTVGVLIGCLLACFSFAYLPVMTRHRTTRRRPVHSDQSAALLSNPSADPGTAALSNNSSADPGTAALSNNSSADPRNESNSAAPPGRPQRVFCLVLTMATRLRLEQARTVRDTWAADCDGLMFVTDRRLPGGFPSFVPRLAAGANPFATSRGQYGALKTALSHAPFSGEEFDFYLLAPDSVFVAMHNLRELVSGAAAGRPTAWGLVTRSYVPGEGRVSHLAGRAGLLLSDAARRRLVDSDCGWPRQAADAQLSLCLHRLGVPQRHVAGFHSSPPGACATAPPPPPARGLLLRLQRWVAGRLWPQHWRPCPPRAVTFGDVNFAVMKKTYFLMNLGVYRRSGAVNSPGVRRVPELPAY